MSREIRKVPANWKHPKTMMPYGYDYQPMHDQNYDEAVAEWKEGEALWASGQHEDQLGGNAGDDAYEEWCGDLPDPKWYRPYKDEECTHFQMYQTVSEGTPVTPVFATLLELEDYLVNVGESAGTKYNEKYSRTAAKRFCESGWAPSGIYTPATGYLTNLNALDALPPKESN